jgi:hypothetical protein
MLHFSSIGQQAAFLHDLITEANAAARANVVALGGNALICHRYHVSSLILLKY